MSCVFVCDCSEAGVVSVYAGRWNIAVWRWNGDQGLGLHDDDDDDDDDDY